MKETLQLSRLFPAMVTDEDGNNRTCRTIFEDKDGGLWCFWYGDYRRVRKIDGSKLPRGRRVKEAYVVTFAS